MRHPGKVSRWLGATAAALLVFAGTAPAQTGSIAGAVRTETGEPVAGAQITVEGTALGTLSRENGQYLLQQVPAGPQRVQAQLIGYSTEILTVTVPAGGTATLNFTLRSEAIALQEIVVTGLSGATIQAKVPFEVASLDQADLPVPRLDAASMIQGKVAGAMVVQGSGRPGSAPSVLLRGPKSIDASGRSQEPLYIVDGVILGSSIVDIDALDIEEIEVLKGAAAASLYGSRAANGVIQITTRRGRSAAASDIRYTARTEYGQSDLPGSFPLLMTHPYQLSPDGTQLVDADGTFCDFLNCGSPVLAGQAAGPGESANEWNTFAMNPWPQTFDPVGQFFTPGNSRTNYLSAAGRAGATNFHVSYSNLEEQGVMPGQEGFERNNFRLNLDQSINPRVQVSASAFYSRSEQDQFPESSGNPLFDLTRMQAGVNLAACEDDLTQSCLNEPERLILNANPTNIESPNPLYQMLVRDFNDKRGRFLGSGNVRYSPLEWLDLDGNVSYDRLDFERTDLFPKGYRTIEPSPTVNEGQLFKRNDLREAFNGSITATARFDLSDAISNRTQLRYLYEQQDFFRTQTSGYEFAVSDVPQFSNINTENLTAFSQNQPIRADGYFAITNFDILDRYIIDALVRNDGSSLFGPDERRHWYYRVAGAWRVAQEPWFALPAVDELKLRYSVGTAGSRPRFEAQYETFSVSGGSVTPVNLGNRSLKPEFSVEQEAGIDAALLGRFVLGLTYANSVTEDQILQVPLPAFTGFRSQWQNAGTLENTTWEASLEARLLRTQNFRWSARVLYDRTRSTITELNVPPFRYGVAGQALGDVYYARPGEELGTFYGVTYATSCDDLPIGVSCDGFTVNDDGWLVWVGSGSLADNQWGEDSDVTIRGSTVKWGTPFAGECTDRSTEERTLFCPVGNSLPDFSVGLSSTLEWKGLSLYGLLDAVQGFDVYNQPLQWALFRRNIAMMDQTGVPEGERKPLGYYDALYGVSGLQPSNAFVEDGSFVKLREVALRYRVGADQLARVPGISAFSGLTLSAIGRNLITWTDYRGYDPEVGRAGGTTGSAALARVDGYSYPNFRTWTLGLELNF